MTDDASSLLKSLRRQIENTEAEIRDKLSSLTRGSKSKYLSDSLVTIRNDRYVIPVKAENRGQFGGVVTIKVLQGKPYLSTASNCRFE